jgi:hypothetical protein
MDQSQGDSRLNVQGQSRDGTNKRARVKTRGFEKVAVFGRGLTLMMMMMMIRKATLSLVERRKRTWAQGKLALVTKAWVGLA